MAILHSIRKDEHVNHALQQVDSVHESDLEQVRFVHQSLSEVSMEEVSLKTTLQDLKLDVPFFINAMTGGSLKTAEINEKLALVARETHLAMATGSMSVALSYPETLQSFQVVRQIHRDGLIFANLGAHHNLENAKRVVDAIQANALQLHLNTPQEIVMPEGDKDFSGWLRNIEMIVRYLDVPVIVKEVGFGMSAETMKQLESIGVSIIDVSGRGGTNFVTIEDARRTDYSLNLLKNWGQTTLESLLEATSCSTQTAIIASGGIKNALDIAKCLSLGANAVGLSGQFLKMITHYSVDDVIATVKVMQEQLQAIMTLLGATDITALQNQSLILSPTAMNWCHARGIDFSRFTKR